MALCGDQASAQHSTHVSALLSLLPSALEAINRLVHLQRTTQRLGVKSPALGEIVLQILNKLWPCCPALEQAGSLDHGLLVNPRWICHTLHALLTQCESCTHSNHLQCSAM
jgi:hypothetical protein